MPEKPWFVALEIPGTHWFNPTGIAYKCKDKRLLVEAVTYRVPVTCLLWIIVRAETENAAQEAAFEILRKNLLDLETHPTGGAWVYPGIHGVSPKTCAIGQVDADGSVPTLDYDKATVSEIRPWEGLSRDPCTYDDGTHFTCPWCLDEDPVEDCPACDGQGCLKRLTPAPF